MTTFSEAAEAYRRRLHMDGRLTTDTERRIATLESHWGGEAVADLTPKRIQEYAYHKYRGRSPSTINRNLNVLSAILGVAEEEGMVLTKPRIKRRKVHDARTVHLELDEIMPVVHWVREKQGPLAGFCVLLLTDTGMRFGEALRFRWGDLREEWITVQPHRGKTKERKVPTSPRLLEYMHTYKVLPTTDDTHSTPIILSRWNSPPTAIGKDLNVLLRGACEATGARCAGDVRVHDLRHTFAFLCASAGADLADIKELMGHTNINMTMRYRGFVQTRAAEVIRRGMATTPPSGITGLEGINATSS